MPDLQQPEKAKFSSAVHLYQELYLDGHSVYKLCPCLGQQNCAGAVLVYEINESEFVV